MSLRKVITLKSKCLGKVNVKEKQMFCSILSTEIDGVIGGLFSKMRGSRFTSE